MNLVDGITTIPVMGSNPLYNRLWSTVRMAEHLRRQDVADVLQRNLGYSRSIQMLDGVLMALRVQTVRNFEQWITDQMNSSDVEEAPVQDPVEGNRKAQE